MPEDYQVPDDPDSGRMDAAFLRTCLGLRTKPGEDPPPLPDAIRSAHYIMSRSLSVLGAMGRTMTPTQLATVVAFAGIEPKAPEPERYSFLAESPVEGQKVVINYRGKDRPGHFLGVTQDKRVLVLHNSNEVRMRPDLVRHPTKDEFPEVADHLDQTVEL
jgi:hypothetical protein